MDALVANVEADRGVPGGSAVRAEDLLGVLELLRGDLAVDDAVFRLTMLEETR